jgi:RNA polymerase sigma-70 factor (ECF subfamily)
VGAERIAAYMLEFVGRLPDLELLERTVNGQPGLIARRGGTTATVAAFDVVGDRVVRIWAVRNPEKLRTWTEGA